MNLTRALRRKRLAFESLESRQMLAFGVTTGVTPTGQTTYVIDNGADLTFAVIKGGSLSSTIHLGDVSSIKYQGQELLAPYSATSRYSHYEQGLSSTTDITYSIGGRGSWIIVTCDDSSNGVVQYYAVRKDDNNLYMASNVTAGGEGRFLAYLSRDVFTNIEEPSDISGNVGSVEGSDVFFMNDGTTRSKFYNTRRMIENEYHGVTGSSGSIDVGAWMFMGNREHSAGGPFFKDHDFQTTGGATEIYNVLFSGHTQTEPYRYGLQGPYSLQFTDGSAPVAPDYSWMENLGLQGWVSETQRGSVSGVATGVVSGNETVVALSSADAQYWTIADATTGAYSIDGVQAGTYTMTLYDAELAVGTRTVTVDAQSNLLVDIANTHYTPAATWRIGEWDGTPAGFLNADKIATMHPSDVRMSPWVDTNFIVGVDTDAEWPMAQFVNVNNGQQISFNLTAAQAATAQTLRIGITLGFAGGRNRITVNAGQPDAWTSAIPAASTNLNSRGITRGTYRGPNQVYTYNIPASALHAGLNTIHLPVVSGSSGSGFLSPNVVYDAIDLVPTASLTNAPRVQTITLTPSSSSVGVGSLVNFTALAKDQFGAPIAANIEFSTTGGAIDQQGHFTAPLSPEAITVTAKSGSISATATVVVLGDSPVIVTPATATPGLSFQGVSVLSVLGDDDGGESNLSYTWTVLGEAPGTVNFSANGTNAAKSTTVTLGSMGTYDLQVTVADGDGHSVTSQVSVSRREIVAHYKSDETAGVTLADSSGDGNTASLTGSSSFGAGRLGNALVLSNGYAALPAGIVSELDDITISTWVKLTSLDTWARVFDFGDSTTNYLFLTPQSSTGRPRFAIRTPGVGEQVVDSSSSLPIGVWTHVAITLVGNTARLYINGVQTGSNTAVTLNPSSLGETAANYIGKSQWPDPALNGAIDDFRIYSRGLSAVEVQALASPPDLFGDYNGDNSVDAADYTVWRDARGASVTPYSGADGDGDGVVDQEDYDVWRTNYGATYEPATFALVTAPVSTVEVADATFAYYPAPALTSERSARTTKALVPTVANRRTELLLLRLDSLERSPNEVLTEGVRSRRAAEAADQVTSLLNDPWGLRYGRYTAGVKNSPLASK
jgi:rhamnogalacturonan endolyase